MKLFHVISTAILGAAMSIGVGLAVANNEKGFARTDAATVGTNLNLVTTITSGNQYVILGANATYALPTKPTVSSGKITGTAVGSVPNDGAGFLWTFTKSGDFWLIGDGTKYVYHSNGGNSGTNLSYGTSQSDFPWSLTYSGGVWTFAGVVASTSSVKNRGMLANGSTFGGYSLSNADSYGAMGIYEVVAAQTYTVSFNNNGGSGSMSSVSGVSGSYTLPACTFTAPNGKAFAGWKANNAGDLIAAGASYNVSTDVTFYAQWADAYTVTYTAGTNGSGSYAHASQPAGTYTLLPFTNLSGVSPSAGYKFKDYTVGGVNKNPGDTITLSAAIAVTVNFQVKPLETTYVFATNYSTYASTWTTTYGPQTIDGKTDVGGEYSSTIVLERVNHQNDGGVGSNEPFLASPKSTTTSPILIFTLTESGYKIKNVSITFTQRASATPTFNLYKGNACAGAALDSAVIGTSNTLETTNLNDVSFSLDCVATASSNNVGAALTSIYITLEELSLFGTLDHISITSFPNTIYHIGESYDSTGFAVMAYDGADETTANFKDVTASVETDLDSLSPYVFQESDVPGFDCDVYYSGDGGSDTTSFHVYVFALAEYELVTSEPADWSGNYLIVGTNSSSELRAMNGSLAAIDVEGNHKAVSANASDVIETGQELEFVIAPYSTGYSIQGKNGKYIGWNNGSANGLSGSDTALVNTLAYSGSGVVISGSGERKLSFNTDGEGRFRYYQTGSVQLYRLKASDDADIYAQLFLEELSTGSSAVCKYNPSTHEVTTDLNELRAAWKSLAQDYEDSLSAADKEQFRLGVASSDPSASNIAKALALYDHIVKAYGTQLNSEGFTNYNFMNRSISSSLGHINIVNNTNTILLVTIITVLSLSAVGGVLLILRKRKHN